MKRNMPSPIIFVISMLLIAACTTSAPATSTTIKEPSNPPAGETPTANPPEPESPTPTKTPTLAPEPSASAPKIPPLTEDEPLLITAIHMITLDDGWAIGGMLDPGDHVLRTGDGGASWRDVTPPEPVGDDLPARKAAVGAFLDTDRAWALFYLSEFFGGPAGVSLWSTIDGGTTWERGSVEAELEINDLPPILLFIDAQTGWILNSGIAGMGHHFYTLLRTNDGGATWQTLAAPPDTLSTCTVNGIAFADGLNGWMTEECAFEAGVFIERTGDGGLTWEPVPLPAPSEDPDLFEGEKLCSTSDPVFYDAPRGAFVLTCQFLTGSQPPVSYLYMSADDGQTWQTSLYPGGRLALSSSGDGWALGRTIYRTSDAGQSWERYKSVSWDGNFSIHDSQNAWAVARADGEIALVRTTDGGRTWAILEPVLVPAGTSGSEPAANEVCTALPQTSITTYFRPSFDARVFAELPAGTAAEIIARTADGWLGFDPAYAQAANIGVFRLRWIPPGSSVQTSAGCDALPVVVGPPPGICFTMPMEEAPVYALPDESSELLATLELEDYAAVTGRSSDGWLAVDLRPGEPSLDLQGWMPGAFTNFNGPCSDLPAASP